MTEKRPVPLQHFILYKDKLHMIKDEFGHVNRDVIEKVLKQEMVDRRNKMQEEKKKGGDNGKDGKVDENGEYKEKKEIDFKEKALKAKENALKAVTAKAIKNQGGGGGSGDGPNSQKKSNNFKKFTDTVRAVAREGLLPCVVFCFSKAQTMDVPKQMDEKLEFTDGYEKGQIKSFLKSKI
jgi:superfamily II RNA helicase